VPPGRGKDAALAAYAKRSIWLVDRLGGQLRARAATTPVLVCVEDVQWADPLSRFALRTLPARLAGSPVVWLVSSRTDVGSVAANLVADVADQVPVLRIPLTGLPLRVLIVIAADRLGRPPGPVMRGLIAGAGGNPGLVVSLAASPPVGGEVPARLIEDVRRRLRSLPAGTRAHFNAELFAFLAAS
jgi:hypothetical protein